MKSPDAAVSEPSEHRFIMTDQRRSSYPSRSHHRGRRYMHRTVLAAAAAVGLSISGCARVQYLTRPVLLPTVAAPVLTPVKSSDVQCLSGATYTALVNRERATWDWGAAQQAIIKANNAKAEVK